jgi:hypothetical protein
MASNVVIADGFNVAPVDLHIVTGRERLAVVTKLSFGRGYLYINGTCFAFVILLFNKLG